MATLTSQQLLHVLNEDIYYAIPHSINAWLNSFKLKHSTKLVAHTLISQVIIRSRNKDRLLIRISKSLLSELSGVGIRTIPSCIKELSKHGIIAIHDTTSIGTLYEIFIDAQCKKFVRPRKTVYMSRSGTCNSNSRPKLGHNAPNPITNKAKINTHKSSQVGTEVKAVDTSLKECFPIEKNQDSIQQGVDTRVSQVGTKPRYAHIVPTRDIRNHPNIKNCKTSMSQTGTDSEKQNQQNIDSKAKALGFDSKEKMLLALCLYRLGKRNFDPEMVEQMINLEKEMMQSVNQRKDEYAANEEQQKEVGKVSQSGTQKDIKGGTERTSIPNWDQNVAKIITRQVKLKKSQIKGIMTRMRKLSDRIPLWREISLEIVWAIENGKIGKDGMTTFHRINAAMKLVKENRWRTPSGYKPVEAIYATIA